MVAEGAAHGVGNFAQHGGCTRSLDGGSQEMPSPVRDLFQSLQRFCNLLAAALTFRALEPGDLPQANRGVIDIAAFNRILGLQPVLTDANEDLLALVDGCLPASSGLLDQTLGQTNRYGLRHTAHGLDFFDQHPGFFGELPGQALDIT